MKGLGLFLLFCSSLGAQPGSLEGTVINAVTGQPMSGVHVRMFTNNFESATLVYGAISNSAGRFSMARVQPGRYTLQPERTGFVFLRAGADPRPFASVLVKPGQRITDLKVEMTPRAVIAGRVVDEFGDPVANIPVVTEAAPDNRGGIGMVGRVVTDDRGEFRMRTTPGKYRIRAMPYVRQDDAPEVRSDGAAAAIYGSTYYPSSMRQEDASVVEAVAGHEITGIELRLLKQERGGAISGLVTGIPEGGSGVSVMLQSGTDGDSATGMQGRGIRQDGKFSFHGVQPGNYRIFARYTAANKELQSQMVDIRLDGGDSADVDLMLAPGGELSGSIEPGGVAPAKRTVRLETVGPVFSSSGRTGEVDENGAFRIGNVLPAKYRLHVDPLPENAYVKSLWIDGAVAGALDLSRGARDVKVKIALGPDGGSLSGAVLDHEGDRLVNSGGWVTLMADADDSDPDHRARITPEGKYSFKGIRPGKYRLFAADPFQSRASGGMEESRKFYASAEEIEIKPGARMVQDVKLASKGNAGAKK